MNPIDFSRRFAELLALPDAEIEIRLRQDKSIAELFKNLDKEQIAHIQKPISDRFVRILKKADIGESIPKSVVSIFEDIGGIGEFLSNDDLYNLIDRYSDEYFIENWSLFSERNKNDLIMFLLIEFRFDVVITLLKASLIDPSLKLSLKKEPLIHLVYRFLLLARKSNREIYEQRVEILYEFKEAGVNLYKEDEGNLLEKAIKAQDYLILWDLLDLGFSPYNKKGELIKFPLEAVEMMDELLDHNSFHEADRNALRLILASKERYLEDAMLLLDEKQINFNVKDQKGETVLWMVIILYFHNKDMYRELLYKLIKHDKIDLNQKDDRGFSFLIYVIKNNDQELLGTLLDDERVDVYVKDDDGKTVFELVRQFDLANRRGPYDPLNFDQMINRFLQHPKLSASDRGGYKLYLAIENKKWGEARELLKEKDLNVNVQHFQAKLLDRCIIENQLEIVKELVKRGVKLEESTFVHICRLGKTELAQFLFDADADIIIPGPLENEGEQKILQLKLQTIFPNWNWDLILENVDVNIIDVFSNPNDLSKYVLNGERNANPLELLIAVEMLVSFPLPDLAQSYLQSLTDMERRLMQEELKRHFPNKTLFLGLKTVARPLEKPIRNLPNLGNFSLEEAIILFKQFLRDINFTDFRKADCFLPTQIFDQSKNCSPEELKQYGVHYCLYMEDCNNSLFQSERQDSNSYQRLRQDFLYEMFYLAGEYKRINEDINLSNLEKLKQKKILDQQIMLMAASGNHCIIAKKDVLGEGLDKAYGGINIPSLENLSAHILHKLRLGIIVDLYTIEDTDPPEILSHDMYAFMIANQEGLGLNVDDLVTDDPHLDPNAGENPETLATFHKLNSAEKACRTLAKDLESPGSEISPEAFKNWLIENVPEDWDQWEEMENDVEDMPSDMAYAYLYRNFSIFPTPEEILAIVNPNRKSTYVENLKKIEQKISQEYSKIEEEINLAIDTLRETLKRAEGEVEKTVIRELARMKTELGGLGARKTQEKRKRKLGYLQENGVVLTPKAYLGVLKSKEGIPKIKKEMTGMPEDEQWKILEDHGIVRMDPYEILLESAKMPNELEQIQEEMASLPQEQQWSVLAKYHISNPNPKTPTLALERYRAMQYANQTYVDNRVRLDRVVRFLRTTKHLDVASL